MEYAHNSLCFVVLPSFLLDKLFCCPKYWTWWTSNQKTFILYQISCICQRTNILSFHPMIYLCSHTSARNKIISDSFNKIGRSINIELFRDSKDASNWISSNYQGVRAFFFKLPWDSTYSSSSSNSKDNSINFSIALVQKFFGKLIVVS